MAALTRLFGTMPAECGAASLSVGIGDDAAVLARPAADLVVSVDEQVEGVHFDRAWLSLEDIGYRATMAALSDLAAMGARPLGIVAAIALPPTDDEAALLAVARGQRAAGLETRCPIVGGNLSRGPVLSVTTTVLGEAEKPLLRSAAKVGDWVQIAGTPGLAAAGLEALRRSRGSDVAVELMAAVSAWRRPTARLADGARIVGDALAAIDVSDGLGKDLGALARASGCAIEIDEAALRALLGRAGVDVAAAALGLDPLELALAGGEDYALVATSPVPLAGFSPIGRCVQAKEGEDRVVRVDASGGRRGVSGGYDHFAVQKGVDSL